MKEQQIISLLQKLNKSLERVIKLEEFIVGELKKEVTSEETNEKTRYIE